MSSIKHHWRKIATALVFVAFGLFAGTQLGSEPPPPPPTPTPTPTNTLLASSIDMGGDFSCAIGTDARVYCWGDNQSNQLGASTTGTCGGTACSTAPRIVPDVINAAQVSAGLFHACVVTTAQAAKCWGDNTFGQLGDLGFCGTTCGPVTPSGLNTGVKEISAGAAHTCAIMTSNEVKCWGLNSNGDLGTGNASSSSSPVTAMPASAASRNSLVTGEQHTCVISAGEVYCWGSNVDGQLGLGNAYACPIICEKDSETLIPGGFDNLVYLLWGGSNHTCAMDGINRIIKCWGQNSHGQLGLNDTSNRNVPTQLFGIGSGVHSMAGGLFHTCTEKNSGLQCWGSNASGQVGDGTTTDRLTPTAVAGFSNVSTVGAGYNHSCLLTTAGNIWCWGDNDRGQLGNGSASDYNATAGLIAPIAP